MPSLTRWAKLAALFTGGNGAPPGRLLKAAKRLFGIPDFRLYALADGIREVCARSPRRAQPGAKDPPQLTLAFN